MKDKAREAFVRQIKSSFTDQYQVGVILRLLNELDYLESEIDQLKERQRQLEDKTMTTLPIFFTPDSAQAIAVQQMPLPKPSFEEMRELWQSYYMDGIEAGCTPRESLEWADIMVPYL